MEKYYLIKKEYAQRAGLDATVREEIGDNLVLSERDLRMISLTTEEKLAALGAIEYDGTKQDPETEVPANDETEENNETGEDPGEVEEVEPENEEEDGSN